MLISINKRGEKAIWECDICKKYFQLPRNRANEAKKKKQVKLCSARCRKKYQKRFTSRRVVNWVKDNGSPNFKKGCGLTTDGYVWIYIGKKQIKIHRYLMEVKLGRKLKPTEIVHHIDFNKLNNNINNLEIVDRSTHNKIHEFLVKKHEQTKKKVLQTK